MIWKTIFLLALAGLHDAIIGNITPLEHSRIPPFDTSVSGPFCYSCDNVIFPSECQHVTSCSEKEVCFTEQYKDSNHRSVYRLGCRPALECVSTPHPGGCMACCNTSHCNTLLCDTLAANQRFCYKCHDLIHPSFCEITTPCELKEEQCFVEKVLTDLYEIRYNFGCMKARICDAITLHGSEKRDDVLANICAECCDADECNGYDCDHA